jgi:isopentenyl-diphosphate Delta-isomerase
VLRALQTQGRNAAVSLLASIEAELRAVMLLTGSRTLADLRNSPRVLTGELRDWIEQLGE